MGILDDLLRVLEREDQRGALVYFPKLLVNGHVGIGTIESRGPRAGSTTLTKT